MRGQADLGGAGAGGVIAVGVSLPLEVRSLWCLRTLPGGHIMGLWWDCHPEMPEEVTGILHDTRERPVVSAGSEPAAAE